MEQNPSSVVLPSSDDFTLEILLRLPAKSIGKFRSVSKRFLSLTTDPQFIKTHSSLISQISTTSFYLITTQSSFIQTHLHHLILLSFLGFKGFPVVIVHSCNGLMLCRQQNPTLLYGCNPTTRVHNIIPVPDELDYSQFRLAFNPSISPLPPSKYSAMGSARGRTSGACTDSHLTPGCGWPSTMTTEPGSVYRCVFWQENILCLAGDLIWCLDVETERFSPMLLPLITQDKCIGESGGHLHLVASADANPGSSYWNSLLDAFEMVFRSSGWSPLYSVDLDAVADVYPEAKGDRHLKMQVLWFLRGGGDEVGDVLLLSVPMKIVAYRLKDKTRRFRPFVVI